MTLDPTRVPNDSSTHHDGSGTPIDFDTLFSICLDDGRIALLVLDRLGKQLAEDLQSVEASLTRFDAEAALRTAHGLKGAAGAAGANGLELAARAVESHAREGALDSAKKDLDALRAEIIRCAEYLPTACRRVEAERLARGRR